MKYELYQSQCLQTDELLSMSGLSQHPYKSTTREGQEYRELGEMAFLDRKRAQFWESVRADPADFLNRVSRRAVGVTLW